jgi:hypothetical protein
MANPYLPQSPFVDLKSGVIADEWRQWLLRPTFLSIDSGTALGVGSGGTGLAATPGIGQILVGTGSGYTLTSTIPASAFPALTGDVTTPGGSYETTLATVNPNVGTFGSSTRVPVFSVNGKGLITAAISQSIDGASFNFTVGASFGCNGKAAQSSAVVAGAIAGTAGAAYTATEQGLINSLLTLVNQLRSALVANGIAV